MANLDEKNKFDMQGGVSLNDRKLAANIRRKLLKEAEKILDGKDEAIKRELLWKMCGTLLPRLQEHTGEDGSAIIVKFDDEFKTPRKAKANNK